MRVKKINNEDAQLLANDVNYFIDKHEVISISYVYNSNAKYYTAFIMYKEN